MPLASRYSPHVKPKRAPGHPAKNGFPSPKIMLLEAKKVKKEE